MDILDYNEDSIFSNSLMEIPNLKEGLDLTLFPVKYYQIEANDNYKSQKIPICYDFIKFIGIGESKDPYLLLSAGDNHYPVKCKSQIINKYLRYSNYCDEFCTQDFIYFSSDLTKCKCNFFIKNEETKSEEENTEIVTRSIERYEVFANTYNTFNKLRVYHEKYNVHFRYFFFVLQSVLVSQIVYAFYINKKSDVSTKFILLFFSSLTLIFYFMQKNADFHWPSFLESIADVYPLASLIFLLINQERKEEVAYHAFLIIIHTIDCILKETRVSVFEIFLRVSCLVFTINLKYQSSNTAFKNLVLMKFLLELVSRILEFSVEESILTDFTIPAFIIFGRPREFSFLNNDLIFQLNYLKILPLFEHAKENWFIDVLSFNEAKNVVLMLGVFRYASVVMIVYWLCSPSKWWKFSDLLLGFKIGEIILMMFMVPFEIMHSFIQETQSIPKKVSIAIFTLSSMLSEIFLTFSFFKWFCVHLVAGVVLSYIVDQEDNDKLSADMYESDELDESDKEDND